MTEALVEFGAEPDQITRDAGLEAARRGLARPRGARPDRRGRVRRADEGGGHQKIETVGQAVDFVAERAGMSRRVAITGVGAVTPLGVGARR